MSIQTFGTAHFCTTCLSCGLGCPICGTCNCHKEFTFIQEGVDSTQPWTITFPTLTPADEAINEALTQVRAAIMAGDLGKANELLDVIDRIRETKNG